MSTTESAPGVTGVPAPPRRRSSRRSKTVAAVVLVLAAAGGWWLVTTPELEGGGVAGVSSPDHEVVAATGLREVVYVVPADGPGTSTLAFGIRNDGPLPVQLVDVWPGLDDPMCLWQPSARWFQDDPRFMGVLDSRARPAAGAVLAPGGSATLWVTGAHPDPAGCVHDGVNLYDDVDVVVRIAGRTSTVRVPLGYTFGYSDDPASLRASYGSRVLPPTEASGS